MGNSDFLGGPVAGNLPAHAGDMGSTPVWEDSTHHGTIKPVHLEPEVHNKRRHHSEKPVPHKWKGVPACCNCRNSVCNNEDLELPKIINK